MWRYVALRIYFWLLSDDDSDVDTVYGLKKRQPEGIVSSLATKIMGGAGKIFLSWTNKITFERYLYISVCYLLTGALMSSFVRQMTGGKIFFLLCY